MTPKVGSPNSQIQTISATHDTIPDRLSMCQVCPSCSMIVHTDGMCEEAILDDLVMSGRF